MQKFMKRSTGTLTRFDAQRWHGSRHRRHLPRWLPQIRKGRWAGRNRQQALSATHASPILHNGSLSWIHKENKWLGRQGHLMTLAAKSWSQLNRLFHCFMSVHLQIFSVAKLQRRSANRKINGSFFVGCLFSPEAMGVQFNPRVNLQV